MSKISPRLPVVAILTLLAGYAYAQGFNLKTGQWQFTMSGLPLALGDLSKLPPQIRAQAEAQMKQSTTYLSCVTPDDLKEMKLGKRDDDDDDRCKETSRKITATTADIVQQCSGAQKRTDTIHFEAPTPETVTMTMNSVSDRGPATMTVTGKWLGAACKRDD